jgi:hypothetical protein
MALKITTQIGTDKGITSEAYVRISNYQLHKFGSANFQIEIFQSEDDATPNTTASAPTMIAGQARNQQIGDSIYVSLMTQEERQVSYPVIGVDADGNALPDRVETITVFVPDLSSAKDVDIFTFGYSHLKAKLVDLFGEDNIVDC